ncbi:protein FAM161B isoform X1 [Erpetoichthys calabaricus]|uniref:protein FAM161B isoform X1 n=1 Tax=Erpetoichthys calabaricus TaxID=27687 RepID=UPI002233FD40|nr:protein FAM161B isoform X1 [Erpetoichthys calabaricus]
MPVLKVAAGSIISEGAAESHKDARRAAAASGVEFDFSRSQGFCPLESSESEDEEMHQRPQHRLYEFLHQDDSNILLDDFYQRMQAMSEASKEGLLQIEQNLEQRMFNDSVLSDGAAGNGRSALSKRNAQDLSASQMCTNGNTKKPPESRNGPLRKSCSLSDLNSKRSFSGGVPWTDTLRSENISSVLWSHDVTSNERVKKWPRPKSGASLDLEKHLAEKQQAELTECKKLFRAAPVPTHVSLALYDEIMERKEKLRQATLEKRKNLLLSMQKPFNFQEREKKIHEEVRQQLETETVHFQKETLQPKYKKKIPESVQDQTISDRLKDEELNRKIRIQMRATDMLKASRAPVEVQSQKKDLEGSCRQRSKKAALAFLDEEPTFHPQTTGKVPDFEKLFRDFQKATLKKAEAKEATRCRPFQLQTSALPPRQSRSGEKSVKDSGPIQKTQLRRSQSLNGISADTLPTYISDATRDRHAAIRKSLEMKENKEKQNVEWMEQHKLKSQAMHKTVNIRAKVMDPHKSLKDVYKEKLRQNRLADRKLEKEYKRELEEMKTRVHVRPYLFEQITQGNAKKNAERRYQHTLKTVGLDEEFVWSKGEGKKNVSESDNDEDEIKSNLSDTSIRMESFNKTENKHISDKENEETEETNMDQQE